MTSQPISSPTPLALTGIAEALAGLQDLDEFPTTDHVARLRAVHDSLTAALSSIDEV
jgi:hypothetical protein